MITGIAVHSSVWCYRMPTQFGIADYKIGWLSQRRGMVRLVQRYKRIQIGWPGLTVLAQTVLLQPVIYRKTLVQSRANLTAYIRTISRRDDLTRMLYIFCIFYDLRLTFFVRITRPLIAVRWYPRTSVCMYVRVVYIYIKSVKLKKQDNTKCKMSSTLLS